MNALFSLYILYICQEYYQFYLMHSSNLVYQIDSPLKTKAKAMALKYQKYCQKKKTEKSNERVKCIKEWFEKFDCIVAKAWNIITPKIIRGPATPYQNLMISLPSSAKNSLQNLSVSKISLTQSIRKNRINLIVTYTQKTIIQTIGKINDNQQINALINKKAQIFPVEISKDAIDQISVKLKQLIESLGQTVPYQDQVFVVWKGLYEQIVVIAHFQLSDINLCFKVLHSVEERDDYEELIKRFAQHELNEREGDQSSMNKISQQSTGTSKCSNEE